MPVNRALLTRHRAPGVVQVAVTVDGPSVRIQLRGACGSPVPTVALAAATVGYGALHRALGASSCVPTGPEPHA